MRPSNTPHRIAPFFCFCFVPPFPPSFAAFCPCDASAEESFPRLCGAVLSAAQRLCLRTSRSLACLCSLQAACLPLQTLHAGSPARSLPFISQSLCLSLSPSSSSPLVLILAIPPLTPSRITQSGPTGQKKADGTFDAKPFYARSDQMADLMACSFTSMLRSAPSQHSCAASQQP